MAFIKKDFFSKMKETVDTVSGMAKDSIQSVKTTYDNKKAELEQLHQEMLAKADALGQEITQEMISSYTGKGIFEEITTPELLSFTKEFFDKILLPASSVSHTNISMYPYLDNKRLQKFAATVTCYISGETALLHLKGAGKREFVLTDQAFYFSVPLPDDPKYPVIGRIPCSNISSFTFCAQDDQYVVKCNDYTLTTFTTSKVVSEDSIALTNFFSCIRKHDLVITDEEVDALIHEKIGEKIYTEVKKYMVYDDELMVYFAWGVNSLAAKDYIVCTTKQIIRVDREVFGATANIRQFYYEDITSASTEQNAKSNDLTTALIETAITAATKTCDLLLTVSGAAIRINNLFKVEAERVVAVYHQFRKLAKSTANQPQVVIQQQVAADPLEQLKKLSEMKALGIITEDEFNQKKSELLAKL